MKGSAGLDASCMPWFTSRDVAILVRDLSLDGSPSGVDGDATPVHLMARVPMGVPRLDNYNLETWGKAAAFRNWAAFSPKAARLPINNCSGSPENPVATF